MEVVVSFDDLVSRLSIEPSHQVAKGQQSAGRKLKTHKPSAYVPNFPLDILQAVVGAGIEKALPLILAIHRQLAMTGREWTPLNSAIWKAAGDPTAKQKETILIKLKTAPSIIRISDNRTRVSHYSVAKGDLWVINITANH